MHEHLDEFGLINMNGRVYDPKLACFLSPDPVISDAGNWLDYNRYSYAWGNPLKYCDPTGMEEATDKERTSKAYRDLMIRLNLAYNSTGEGEKKTFTYTEEYGFVDQNGKTLCGISTDDLKKLDDAIANTSYDTGTNTTPNTSDKKVTQPGGAPIGVDGSRGDGSGVHAEHEEEMIDWDGTGSQGGIRGFMQLVQKFFSPSPKVETKWQPEKEETRVWENELHNPVINSDGTRDTLDVRLRYKSTHGVDSQGTHYYNFEVDTVKKTFRHERK